MENFWCTSSRRRISLSFFISQRSKINLINSYATFITTIVHFHSVSKFYLLLFFEKCKVAETVFLVDGRVQSALLPGLILILIAVTGWMKLVSYAHANKDLREILKAGEQVLLTFDFLVVFYGSYYFFVQDFDLEAVLGHDNAKLSLIT